MPKIRDNLNVEGAHDIFRKIDVMAKTGYSLGSYFKTKNKQKKKKKKKAIWAKTITNKPVKVVYKRKI